MYGFDMLSKNTILAFFKSLTYLSLTFALVLALPYAGQTASNIHGEHHVSASFSEYVDQKSSNSEISSTYYADDKFCLTSKFDVEEHSSNQDCSYLFLSVVLSATVSTFVNLMSSSNYPSRYSQAKSIKLFSFLRPPQFLI